MSGAKTCIYCSEKEVEKDGYCSDECRRNHAAFQERVREGFGWEHDTRAKGPKLPNPVKEALERPQNTGATHCAYMEGNHLACRTKISTAAASPFCTKHGGR